MSSVPFRKVKRARELLKEKAEEILAAYMATIDEAKAKGEFEVALEHLWKLIEHMPNEDGERLIDPTAAKQPKEGPTTGGPTIQIGFALGGMDKPKQLEAKVIDQDDDE